MSGLIGSGDGQLHIIGGGDGTEGSGYGGKPSLPTHLRHASAGEGPWRPGEFLQGASAPLSIRDAQALNRWHGYAPPTGLPPSADDLGAWLANIDPRRNASFYRFMCGASGFHWVHKALMDFNNWGPHHTMGIGMADISRAFGFPGSNNHELIRTLTHWAQQHPGTRRVLDAATQQLLDEGRIPRNIGDTP